MIHLSTGSDTQKAAAEIIKRCLLDFMRRGGLDESNVEEAAERSVQNLDLVGGLALIKRNAA